MKIKLHWEINNWEDSIVVEEETIEKIKEIAKQIIPSFATNKWSEKINE